MTDPEQQKIDLLEREVRVKERELNNRINESAKTSWRSPLVVAIFAAAIGALGNAFVAGYSSSLDRQAAKIKFASDLKLAEQEGEHQRILQMVKIGEPAQVQRNLEFLINTKLVKDPATIASIKDYYDSQEPGTGPGISGGLDRVHSAPENNPAVAGCGEDLSFVPRHNGIAPGHKKNLIKLAAATGRIELDGHAAFDFLGTGFLVAEDVLLTGGFVVDQFSTEGVIRAGYEPMVNFDATLSCFTANRAKITEVLHSGRYGNWTFSLLRIERPAGFDAQVPQLEFGLLPNATNLALISHPTNDPRRSSEDLHRAFNDIFGVKRIALGKLLEVKDQQVEYGLFSSGGSAGGPVMDLSSGRIVALHLGGVAGQGGMGMPIKALIEDSVAQAILSLSTAADE